LKLNLFLLPQRFVEEKLVQERFDPLVYKIQFNKRSHAGSENRFRQTSNKHLKN
jgi:hypothetical protein